MPLSVGFGFTFATSFLHVGQAVAWVIHSE